MTVTDSGDSAIIDAFGFGGESTGDTTQETKAPAETALSEEKDEAQGEQVDTSSEDTSTEAEVDSSEKKRLEDAHLLVVNTIEDQFKALDRGEMSALELREWFEKNPDFADVANRSKRMKERYRSFIATPKEELSPQKADEENKKPLTLDDLKEYDRQREAALLRRQYERENESTFTEYAQQYGITSDQAERLKSVTAALLSTNDDWNYKQALSAAHRAISVGKPGPVGVASGGITPTPTQPSQEKVDLSSWSDAVSYDDFTS